MSSVRTRRKNPPIARRINRRGALAALAWGVFLLGGARAGQAQSVRVIALDGQTGDVAPSTILFLLDSANVVVARALTDIVGQAVLRGPRAGQYRVRADRIGYETTYSDPFPLDNRLEPVVLRLRLGNRRVQLPDVVVTANRLSCGADAVAGQGLGEAWSEARKVLTAASITQETVRPLLELRTIERQLTPDLRLVSERALDVRRTTGAPFVTVDPATIWAKGFATGDRQSVRYFAPDADLLLRDEFLQFHCFRLAFDQRDHRGLVGLAFEPLPSRTVPEIEGTLWLDLTQGTLRDIDFIYVNVEDLVPESEASGNVRFKQIPGVGWIVDRWYIRSPRLVRADPSNREDVALAGFFETGGESSLVSSPVPPALITGTVWDSLAGGPLVGAQVMLAGGDPSTTTDQRGSYVLALTRGGDVAVEAVHPRLAIFGVTLPPVHVELGKETRVDIAVPGTLGLLRRFCSEAVAADPHLGLLAGFLRDAGGAPLVDVDVTVRWVDPADSTQAAVGATRATRTLGTSTDDDGRFQFCGLPVGSDIGLRIGPDTRPWSAVQLKERIAPVVMTADPALVR